jgi:DNA-binding MarR family transcriptional regulator
LRRRPAAISRGTVPQGLSEATVSGVKLDPGEEPPFEAVGFLLSSLGYAVSRQFHAVLKPLGLEPRHFAVLRTVRVLEGATQQAVASFLQIPPSRMVAILDNLEARRLVERRQRPDDRRSRAMFLTPAGEDLLARAKAVAVEFEQKVCGDMAPDDRAALLRTLKDIGARLGVPAHSHAALHDRDGHPEAAADDPTDGAAVLR